MSDSEKIGLLFAVLVVLSVMKSCTDKLASSVPRPLQKQSVQHAPQQTEAPINPAQAAEQLAAAREKQAREALEKRKLALLKQYDALQIRLEEHQ